MNHKVYGNGSNVNYQLGIANDNNHKCTQVLIDHDGY